jgi:hypothetical protein
MLDLVMFQINVFTLQSTNKKRESDIEYISNLLEEIRSRGPINLLPQQRRDMKVAFEWFLEDQPTEKREFWSRELGFRSSDTRSGETGIHAPSIHNLSLQS